MSGCEGAQSALHPASAPARETLTLFWVMAIGGALLWLLVFGIAVYGALGRRRPVEARFSDRFILIGGVLLPLIVLFPLMAFSLRLLPDWREGDPPDWRVEITAEQFWWRIVHVSPEFGRVETANRLILPLGQEIEFVLMAEDVIHSFWVPPLGGKLDMIPGRVNRLRLTPDQPGRYRGVCAEFCGLSHALMAFEVEVLPPEAFTAWLVAEAAPAVARGDDAAFRAAGCGACHQIRGRVEEGGVGPDLTHLAARARLGADSFPNDRDHLARWLRDPQAMKPGALMPGYADLPETALGEILDLLESLE